jgi:integrase
VDQKVHYLSRQATSEGTGRSGTQRLPERSGGERTVSASTQNQALNAILFLYREVLRTTLARLKGVQRAKKLQHLPVVLTRDEVKHVLAKLDGTVWLMAAVTYGAGLRLQECLRLRVKDLEFNRSETWFETARDKKTITRLPRNLADPLRTQLAKVRQLHEQDLAEGFGRVYLPFALDRKYPNTEREWSWSTYSRLYGDRSTQVAESNVATIATRRFSSAR